MKLKRFVCFTLTATIATFLSITSVLALTQGFTQGQIGIYPYHIINQITGVATVAADASTKYTVNIKANVKWIEAKVSDGTKEIRRTGQNMTSIQTGKLTLGPNTGSYTIYSFHDVDLGTARSYFHQSERY